MPLDQMIAYCGLNCTTCPIYLATLEKDIIRQKEMRKAIAQLCNEKYSMDLRVEDITDCDGCLEATGRLFFGCVDCMIRKCAQAKPVENCAACPDYSCEILEKHLMLDPDARDRLEAMRKNQS